MKVANKAQWRQIVYSLMLQLVERLSLLVPGPHLYSCIDLSNVSKGPGHFQTDFGTLNINVTMTLRSDSLKVTLESQCLEYACTKHTF